MLGGGLGSLRVGVVNEKSEHASPLDFSVGIRAGLHLIAQGKVRNDCFSGCRRRLAGSGLCRAIGSPLISRRGCLTSIVRWAEVPCRIAPGRNRNWTLTPASERKDGEANK